MSTLDLIVMPNHILRKKASYIDTIDNKIKDTANSMLTTMYKHKGIGLAGNQVNILQRIIVIDLQENNIKNPLILINPDIIEHSEEMIPSEEGCLSLPEITHTINRYSNIIVRYTTLNNMTQTIEASNLLSYCLQHEIDHLNGILFIDHLSTLKKDFILKKYNKSRQKHK